MYYPNMPVPTGGSRALARWYKEKADYETRKAQEEQNRARHRAINSATQDWLMSLQREQQQAELERAHEAHRAQRAKEDAEAIKQHRADECFRLYWESVTDDDRVKWAYQFCVSAGIEPQGCGFKSRDGYERTIKALCDINRCPVSYRAEFITLRRSQLGLPRY